MSRQSDFCGAARQQSQLHRGAHPQQAPALPRWLQLHHDHQCTLGGRPALCGAHAQHALGCHAVPRLHEGTTALPLEVTQPRPKTLAIYIYVSWVRDSSHACIRRKKSDILVMWALIKDTIEYQRKVAEACLESVLASKARVLPSCTTVLYVAFFA